MFSHDSTALVFGFGGSVHACASFRETAQIIIHVHLDRLIDFFLKDTHYRNQFETKRSCGLLSETSRIEWENRLYVRATVEVRRVESYPSFISHRDVYGCMYVFFVCNIICLLSLDLCVLYVRVVTLALIS
jgi:hypothetical protein